MSRHADFYIELKALQEKYPMVYVETWCPEDFACDDGGDIHGEVDWDDPKWIEVAKKLAKQMDAQYGTNWDRVREAVEDVEAGS